MNWRRQRRLNLAPLLRTAEELIARSATLADLYRARCESGCDNGRVTLLYLDYLLARRKHEAEQRAS